ncbi:MAG: hypothetical protein ACT4UQ_06105 [Gammaproteobacteria bacterium]
MANRTVVLTRLLVVIALGLGGCFGGTTFEIIYNPVPTITSLSPSSVTAGSPSFDLTINGSGFGTWSQVRFGSVTPYNRYQFVSVTPTAIVIRIGAPSVATAGQITVAVDTLGAPPTGGTATAVFTINNGLPSVASVVTNLPPPNDQNSVPAGGPAFRMMVTGSGFVPGSLVRWDGIARVTDVLSPNQVTTDVPASDSAVSRTVQVSVFNPAPGGGQSTNSVPFTFYYVLTLIPCPVCILPWFQPCVTFDNPAPQTAETPLDGLYPRPPSNLPPRLNFGTGQWDWAAEVINGIPVNDAFYSVNAALPVNSRSFSFANGPRVLSSVKVISKAAGTLTLRDDSGRTATQAITVGPVQTVATGWSSQQSAAIAVEFTGGRQLGITEVCYLGVP